MSRPQRNSRSFRQSPKTPASVPPPPSPGQISVSPLSLLAWSSLSSSEGGSRSRSARFADRKQNEGCDLTGGVWVSCLLLCSPPVHWGSCKERAWHCPPALALPEGLSESLPQAFGPFQGPGNGRNSCSAHAPTLTSLLPTHDLSGFVLPDVVFHLRLCRAGEGFSLKEPQGSQQAHCL